MVSVNIISILKLNLPHDLADFILSQVYTIRYPQATLLIIFHHFVCHFHGLLSVP